MSDLVVTVPKGAWFTWLSEGDAAGALPTAEEWAFYLGGSRPAILPGERLYIVAWGRLRGYAPVTRVVQTGRGWAICRRGGAVAVTIPEAIPGFRGWRAVWWRREDEQPFPDWMHAGVGRDPVAPQSHSMQRWAEWLTRTGHNAPERVHAMLDALIEEGRTTP